MQESRQHLPPDLVTGNVAATPLSGINETLDDLVTGPMGHVRAHHCGIENPYVNAPA
jgi:hypothetical protein